MVIGLGAGVQVYCAEHGTNIVANGDDENLYSIEYLQECYEEFKDNPVVRTCTYDIPNVGTMSYPIHAGAAAKAAGFSGHTPTYYTCEGNHQIVSGADAYMIYSATSGGEWSGELQQAIWQNNISSIDASNGQPAKSEAEYGSGTEKGEDVKGSSELVTAGNSYGDFMNQITNENGEIDPQINITFGGNTKVDQGFGYIVGPFNVEYVGGDFGKITDMKVSLDGGNLDYTYYQGDKEYTPGTEQGQSYPTSGSDFTLSYANPGSGSKTLTISVTYEWVEYYAQICTMNGTRYEFDWVDGCSSHTTHIHFECPGGDWDTIKGYHTDEDECTYLQNGEECEHTKREWKEHTCSTSTCPYDPNCVRECIAVPVINAQTGDQPIVAVQAIEVRKSKTVEITVTIKDGFDPYIDIGGSVWEDLRQGKDSSVDGKQAENEPAVSGITVHLYRQDKKHMGTTKTDENGEYLFTELDPMYKYYVEFEYNGQRYENTVYQSEAENGVNPLSGGYSNATESTEDRDAFNKKFEEINGDEGYTLENQDTYLSTEPFGISAYTGSDGDNPEKIRMYPGQDKFTIVSKQPTTTTTDEDGNEIVVDNHEVGGDYYEEIYQDNTSSLLEIDFGITKRIEFDMAVKKDLFMATVKINGKTNVYGYDKKNIGNNDGQGGDDTWQIEIIDGYERGVDNSDYNFRGQNGNSDELLEVYVTYKVAVRNQSQSMIAHVTKLIDYYDETFEYQENLSWVSATNYKTNEDTLNELQNQLSPSSLDEEKFKITGASDNDYKDKEGNIVRPKAKANEEQNTLTIDVNKKQKTGETVYLYLTFKIKSEDNKVRIENEEEMKENHIEIGSFITYYKSGTILPHYNGENNYKIETDNVIAGRIDKDSIPSNYDGKEPIEDDEDKAPDLRVYLTGNVRKITGTVWEDERNKPSSGAMIGDGIRSEDEIKISGVKVQLIELVPTGKTCRWAEVTTDENGAYEFANVIPGDYVVRFVYGDKGSLYNGQDYKSTLYQIGVTQDGTVDSEGKYKAYTDVEKQNESNVITSLDKKYGYDIAKSEDKNISDAKDLWKGADKDVDIIVTDNEEIPEVEKKTYNGREEVNNYSKEGVTNHKAEVLASLYETPTYEDASGNTITTDVNNLQEELSKNTIMTAETGVIVMEIDKNKQFTIGSNIGENDEAEGKKDETVVVDGDKNIISTGLPSYSVENVDLGLVERPKAQLEIDKSITNLRLVLANGSVLFDVNNDSSTGVDDFIWQKHTAYDLANSNDYKENKMYEEYYGRANQNRYSYREEIMEDNDNGLIQITMDEELMHGATIQITYKVKVTNVGEIDYADKNFYYKGEEADADANIVKTTANQVVDYVTNNLQFYDRAENEGWNIISKDNLMKNANIDDNLVNSNLEGKVSQFNNIIITDGLNEPLIPGGEVEKTLILSQLITAENENNDMTYSNMVEIVKTSNTVGRRMAYSVVGNQDPTALKAAEVDSSMAEEVIILPPFGEVHLYYILGAVIALILIGGIALIIKKVQK